MDLLSSRRNQFFAPIAALLLWGTQFAWAIEAWRRRNGPFLGRLDRRHQRVRGALLARGLCLRASRRPVSRARRGRGPVRRRSARPTRSSSRAVPNDVRLDRDTRVLVVSGSNMSGKSTLLRTVGVATVLALAGAPVRARRLRLSPLAVGATLRIQDSLQAGRSRFFAELTRLRTIVDVDQRPDAGALPARRAAGGHQLARPPASAPRRWSRGLVERGAIGLVTTHDLALAEVVGDLGVHATQRALQRLVRERRDPVRLPDAARRGPHQQRAGADASSRIIAVAPEYSPTNNELRTTSDEL